MMTPTEKTSFLCLTPLAAIGARVIATIAGTTGAIATATGVTTGAVAITTILVLGDQISKKKPLKIAAVVTLGGLALLGGLPVARALGIGTMGAAKVTKAAAGRLLGAETMEAVDKVLNGALESTLGTAVSATIGFAVAKLSNGRFPPPGGAGGALAGGRHGGRTTYDSNGEAEPCNNNDNEYREPSRFQGRNEVHSSTLKVALQYVLMGLAIAGTAAAVGKGAIAMTRIQVWR